MKKIVVLFIFLFVLGFEISYFFGAQIPVSQILPFLEILTNISSILLGVMGVWLSLIWNNDLQERNGEILYIKMTLMSSFLSITFFLIVRQFYPLFLQVDWFHSIKAYLRIALFFFSVELTFLTIISIILIMLSFDFFSFDKEVKKLKKQEKKNINNRRAALTQNVDENTWGRDDKND